jgi:hypothetical protein
VLLLTVRQLDVVLMSQSPLTLPFQRGRSKPVMFRSIDVFPVLLTSDAIMRGGSAPSWNPPKPLPAIEPA